MRSDWQSFLERTGAVLGDGRALHFGGPEREARWALVTDILCDLSHQGLIAATDADTETFLQGQLTCDVRQVSVEHSRLGAYCSPKGRMLASFRLFKRGHVYYLSMPREQVEPTLRRLRLFVLRARTTLADASDTLVRFGLAGPHADALLREALGLVPAREDNVVQVKDVTVIRVQGMQPRFELHGEFDRLAALWTSLADAATPVGAESWRLLNILAGVPTIYPKTTEAFVPQMVNLQLLDGVSFRKGCYVGQEVVARTQHLGKLKRRMYRAHVNSAAPPRPGDEIFSLEAGAEQSVGRIVDAGPHPDGGYEVLAVVLIDWAEGDNARLGSPHGPALAFAPLPYPFEEPRG